MILAERPVISVNGNVTALAAENITKLGKAIPAKIEVNIFHYSQDRFFKILRQFQKLGEKNILGEYRDKNIPGLDHVRGQCTNEGIYTADTVLVPLEDGDRAQALRRMGKDVITIDLNPLSRTAKAASITIVDNLVRVIPKLTKAVNNLMILNKTELLKIKNNFDNIKNLKEMLKIINERLTEFDF
jgi:4-phosphopantoate--beta-alanine ligase